MAQSTHPKPPTVSTAGDVITLADLTPTLEPISSSISLHSIQSLFIMVIASDRFGHCLYECEIAPEDNCGVVMAKVREAVIKVQSSIWDRLLRLLFPILFTYVIGVAEYEEAHVSDSDLDTVTTPVRVILRTSYANAHLQLAWSYPPAECGAFCSSSVGRDVRCASPREPSKAVILKRRLSRIRTYLLASVFMIVAILISYAIGFKLGWQVGLGLVAVVYAFITAVQAFAWLVERGTSSIMK